MPHDRKTGFAVTVTNTTAAQMLLPGFRYHSKNFATMFRRIKTLSGDLSVPGREHASACMKSTSPAQAVSHHLTMWHSLCAVHAFGEWSWHMDALPGLAPSIDTHYGCCDPQTVSVMLLTTGWHARRREGMSRQPFKLYYCQSWLMWRRPVP